MKPRRLTRRQWILGSLAALPVGLVADSFGVEPNWLRTRHLVLTAHPTHRVLHFTDLHHKGNRSMLEKVVAAINRLRPDLVCFTGDLIEEAEYLPETLEVLAGIRCPMYGVPGNHDYWSEVPFDGITRCFAGTGGAWLLDEQRVTGDGKVSIFGATCLGSPNRPPIRVNPATRNLLLIHYPNWVKRVNQKFDLVLAGHSHGGQVRLPFYGPVVIPFGVDEYDLGLFQTPVGPLYVNPGIGWFAVPARFRCRPEVTLIEL